MSRDYSLKNNLNLFIDTVGKSVILVTLYIFIIFQITRVYLLFTTAYYQTAARAYKTDKLKFVRSHPDALRIQGD